MSADRHILYKIQNKILKEIIEISGKLKTEKFRKATLESTSKSLENKMEEAKLNNYKLEQLGPNSDVYFKDNIWERIESSYEKCKEHMQQIREEPENEETGSEKVELALLTNPTTTTEHEKGARKKENQGAVMEQFRALQENMLLQFQTQQEQLKRQQEIFQKKMEQMLQEQLYEKKREVTQQVEERAALKELTIATPHTNSDRKNAVLSQFRRRIMKFSDAMEADISGVSIYALENMKSMWEKQFDDIKRLHLELTTEHGMEEVDEELEDIEEKMNTKIQNIIVKMSGLKEESQTVELKRIEIPCFNGNVEEWNSFHDLFKKMVDGNSQLSEVQKLYYLKTNLRGDAFRLIQHLQITDANYKAAWELLEKRYNNKRILFTKLVDKILDHPSINSQVAVGLRKLLDSVNESIHALKAMDIPLDHADPILARIIIRKLDKEGLIQYEQNVKKSKEIQRLADVLDFLEQQYQALEASTSRKQFVPGLFKPQDRSGMAEKKQCRFCKFNGHDIVACRKFAAQSSNERYSWVKTAQLCLKCLKHGKDKRCLSDSKCQKCGLSHNTLIHLERISNTKAMTTNSATNVLLATAQVRVKSLHGEYVTLRALIDQGSQITSVSEDAAQLLQLPKTKTEVKLRGLGETMVGMAKSKVLMEIRPRFVSNTKIKVEALVLPKLASAHPDNSFQYNIGRWKNINLADPNFNKSERIDLVIGADLFPQILEGGVRHDEAIVAQNTKFGWILSGKILMRPGKGSGRYVATTTIERFWEIEEIEDEETIMEDDYCLKLYEETTRVDQSGRFVVRLPFAEDKVLGESHKRAMARFLNMEKRLEECTELREEYVRTIDELISMGHMVKVETKKLAKYYMPHQAVVRETSLTTKVRVVFDASSKTSNGKSLNDILHTGPKLQKDIFDIITKWRSWRFVISADVEKMFRQIKVEEEDQEYQYVLWRNSRSEPVQQYKLTTVTYGTASAPFLAIRTLIEIGKRCTNQGIGNRIKDDFYMDDLLTGANSKEECRDVQKLISKELETYGLHLRKWIANAPEVLCAVSRREENEVLQIREDECLKTLGLQWNPTMDCFTFNMQIGGEDRVTKRLALSSLAKIFDPLGWLTPVTVTAKLFIQYLWRQQIEWDVPLEEKLSADWKRFAQSLHSLKSLQIPRWFQITPSSGAELHGFADASEKAYAAVVYLKVESEIIIVAAKSKVNPIKNAKTLPKLELCAAHLLAKLLQKIKRVLTSTAKMYAWSDSMITLAWINNSKNKDKFIRNRVVDILERIPEAKWGYVKSKENPADLGSRGVPPETLITTRIWWDGPEWLVKGEQEWPKINEKLAVSAATRISAEENGVYEKIMQFSSFKKQQRVMAYILRFIKGLRGTKAEIEHLTAIELEEAEMRIIKLHQELEWPAEIKQLKVSGAVDHRSKLALLHPQLDSLGVMRVGGRLHYSTLPYNQKHPIIIQKSRLAGNIIRHTHFETLHGGNRVMENMIRRKYWIIGAKSRIKLCIRCCPTCIRYRGEVRNQLMGDLPACRVNISQPFQHCGIDYAGPIQLRCSKTRGTKAMKGYVAVFVCMVTKAIHLEAVSELTTDAFLAALRRFFARRGKSSDIYSDNGTNFVGASKQLEKDYVEAIKNNFKVAPILENEQVKWHFIPPAAPHFGGIWEAAVKSMKHHLKRIIGDTKLTYEEVSTVLSQIEAVLNSRPLHELSSSTEDVDTITPGHFLIGRPLLEAPAKSDEGDLGCVNRWKLIQRIKNHFWRKWKEEYLTSLQNRTKWRKKERNLEVGQMVILRNEDTHPARWPLAKVTEVHTGKDGVVRVVTVKTQSGELKRPVHKLCPLEHEDERLEEKNMENLQRKNAQLSTTRRLPSILGNPTMMMIMLVNICMLMPTKATFVHELNSSTAMYLDPISQTHMSSSSWNMVIYFEMRSYLDALELAARLLDKSKEICPRLQTFQDQCWSVIRNMEYKISKIKANNRLFMKEDRRQKRGAPLKFVGSFQHWVFGVMDDEDRVAMENNVRNLLANQHDLKELERKQTSVVDATVNLLKRTTDEVNSHFTEMKCKIENISATMNENYYVYRESIRFFIITKEIHESITECDEAQKEVIDVLLEVNNGHFHPVLMSPSQLQSEIIRIRNALPEKYVLPGKSTGAELKEVLHLMRGHGMFVGTQLVIDLKIPLFNRQSSQLYRVIPIPFERNNAVMIARTKAPYIVYNFELDSFHYLTQAMLNECKGTLDDEIVCEENFPWRDASTNDCELAPLRPHINLKCTYDEVENSPYFIQLKRKANWLFKIFANTTAHVKCSDKQQTLMELPQQGILVLEPDCAARIDQITLVAVHQQKDEISSKFPSVLLKDVSPAEREIIKPLGNVLVNHHEEINQLKKVVDNLKKEGIKLRGLEFHHWSGHLAFILVIIISIILIILCIRGKIRKRRIAAIQFPGVPTV